MDCIRFYLIEYLPSYAADNRPGLWRSGLDVSAEKIRHRRRSCYFQVFYDISWKNGLSRSWYSGTPQRTTGYFLLFPLLVSFVMAYSIAATSFACLLPRFSLLYTEQTLRNCSSPFFSLILASVTSRFEASERFFANSRHPDISFISFCCAWLDARETFPRIALARFFRSYWKLPNSDSNGCTIEHENWDQKASLKVVQFVCIDTQWRQSIHIERSGASSIQDVKAQNSDILVHEQCR